jgi:hypothetical protein
MLAFVGPPASAARDDGAAASALSYDCGTIALHTMLMIEGSATRVVSLEKCLSRADPRGYSMAQLRDAAGSCGLILTGVQLPRSDRAPATPALVLTNREGHGHFLVIRPVGHSGKLIQVFDSVGPPFVIDAAELCASREWTGMALVPSRINWPLSIACGFLIVSTSTLVLLLIGARLRATSPIEP